jgi:hypothetical protein
MHKDRFSAVKRTLRIAIFAVPMLATVSGCGESRVPVFPVSGKVSYQGLPPVGAQLVFHRVDGPAAENVVPTGRVQPDGSFAMGVYEPGDGAPPGEYVATIERFKLVTSDAGSGAGPNVLPKQYANSKTSPIKVSVSAAPTQVEPIVIK